MKHLRSSLAGMVFLAASIQPVCAQQMVLRDAIYLYNQAARSVNYAEVRGYHCDVLELVLDVESGYMDLTMSEDSTLYPYPDRIMDYAEMFAYALYNTAAQWKGFRLGDKNATAPDAVVGRGTVFGYCYSTRTDAYVLRYDKQTGTCLRSNGSSYAC